MANGGESHTISVWVTAQDRTAASLRAARKLQRALEHAIRLISESGFLWAAIESPVWIREDLSVEISWTSGATPPSPGASQTAPTSGGAASPARCPTCEEEP